MSFHVGDEVVCVKIGDGPRKQSMIGNGYSYPKLHGHYTVREVTNRAGVEGLLLAEIVNPPVMTTMGVMEVSWIARPFFSPVKRETIQLFRQMCVSNKPLVKV